MDIATYVKKIIFFVLGALSVFSAYSSVCSVEDSLSTELNLQEINKVSKDSLNKDVGEPMFQHKIFNHTISYTLEQVEKSMQSSYWICGTLIFNGLVFGTQLILQSVMKPSLVTNARIVLGVLLFDVLTYSEMK